jgi:hypothetical protein
MMLIWGRNRKDRQDAMTGAKIAVPLGLAVALAIAAFTLAPRAFEAEWLLAAQDDPVALADRAVARTFDVKVAAREIEAALAAKDVDLANSFLELARERQVPVDPALAEKVEAANGAAAIAVRSLGNFAHGVIVGEPDDLSGLAGTAVADLFVIGDIRDAVREGTRFATGQETDQLLLGLSCVGLAVTAGTYASVGAGAPARIGLTVVKAARKTGRISSQMSAWITRSVHEVIDWGAIQRVARAASITQPAVAVRAAREAVKVDKAKGLMRMVGDVGTIQAKAGTRAALDGLKLAQGPRDVAKISKLAAAKGGKTRAILKLAGRGAFLLLVSTFNLTMWIFWALLMLFGFVSSLKKTTERMTERYCVRRRRRIARARERCEREQRAAAAAAAREPTLVYSSAPGLVPDLQQALATGGRVPV